MKNKFANFNEDDIRPSDLMDDVRKAYQADLDWLLDRKSEFVKVDCPACQSEESDEAFVKNKLTYLSCCNCKTIYISPRPSLDLISSFYENSQGYKYWAEKIFPASENIRKESIFKPRAEEVIHYCKNYNINNELLVEIGSGFGTFSQVMKELGYFNRVISIEPNSDLAEKCREKGLEVINSVVEDVKLSDKADVIVSFEVIEHLFSVKEFLVDSKKILKNNGLAIFSCPNILGFDNLVLGSESSTVDHEHLNYFHPESLKLLFTNCGFNVVKVTTPGKLDADIVRNHAISHPDFLSKNPFLKNVLIDRWDTVGDNFQKFLSDNNMSGHMWIVALNNA